MKNVIDITKRRKKAIADEAVKAGKAPKGAQATKASKAAQAPIIDMTEARNEIISEERRKVRRTILSEFIGACALVPNRGLIKVKIYDVSDSGMAFDVESDVGQFKQGEEVAMRVYLNAVTYFPFVVTVQNVRSVDNEGVFRHGVNLVKGTINKDALHHFVKFIETVSASLQSDHGDIMVSNLTR